MSYAAPTREMLFVMKEIGGLDAVLQQPGHEEVDPDLVDAILGEADKFAGIGWEPSALGSPKLKDALAWIDCTIYEIHPEGDHDH